MDGTPPAVVCRDGLQLSCHRRIHTDSLSLILQGGSRGHVSHDGQNPLGLCRGAPQRAVKLCEERIAVVDAADHVVICGNDAVRSRLDIVRDDHLLPGTARLIQGSQLPEVSLGFGKAPVGFQAGAVELGQRDSTGVLRVHGDQLLLHFSAFGLPEGCEGVGDAAHDLVGIFKAVPASREATGARAVCPFPVQGLHLAVCKGDQLFPVREGLSAEPLTVQQHSNAFLIRPQKPVHQIGLEKLMDALAAQRPRQGLPLLLIDCGQQRALRIEHELLDGRYQQGGILQVEATLLSVP
mmetsp:Transcript_54199/g.127373  ORF Transcript_54199/g.127373 Transcript_54199/m.127373 type:complete len:295 (-) Transcript_54199:348-1232(-)